MHMTQNIFKIHKYYNLLQCVMFSLGNICYIILFLPKQHFVCNNDFSNGQSLASS